MLMNKEINHTVGSAELLHSAINHSSPTLTTQLQCHILSELDSLSTYILVQASFFCLSKYWKTAHCCTDGYIQHGYTPPLKVLSLLGWFIQKLSKDSNALQSQQELANSSESDSKSTKQHSLPAQPSCEGVNLLLILLRLSTTRWLVRTSAITMKNVVIRKISVALLLMIIAVFIHDTQNRL